ncbi:stage V sporulation protein AC [Candidatus Formimonas warabiya]|uniref:Stage V sporulation protein AC n=1 Tax=Formimonas warabiya TaxID=1761012 RepID=A0A3G1L111_FORW1|nr:stage V sporulation protein AC [Candidatus Formimonas warabiya]ATW28348.1 stage V sporulation protein AC [Candidatus Formimonas warabiya]
MEKSVQSYRQQEYQAMVHSLKPSPPILKNALAAFSVGGFICAFGQVFFNLFSQMGMNEKDAGTVVIILMLFIGAFLTGLGIYDNLGKFAGAGSIIPITGFANSIVSSAMEWKREGYLFGVGARMFTIAGPVLVYGLLSSAMIGLIAFLW